MNERCYRLCERTLKFRTSGVNIFLEPRKFKTATGRKHRSDGYTSHVSTG